MRFLVCLLWILGTLAVTRAGEDSCPDNEQFSECGANACQNTCKKPKLSETCKDICTPGCVCAEGHLRHPDGTCVPEYNCPTMTAKITTTKKPIPSTTISICPKNEVYSKCGNHGCQDTCENPNKSKVSTCDCNPGCICRDGYLRNTMGVCVEAVECDTCGPNEVFDLCKSTACQSTCLNPALELICTPPGCNAGCICKDGFLRSQNNQCVPKAECDCGDPNAYFDLCGGPPCPLNCKNIDDPPSCPDNCNPLGKCACKEGFIFDYNQKCIRPEECPRCIQPNTFYDTCGDVCPLTCFNKDNPPPCQELCRNIGTCSCKPGFVRSFSGDCIPPEECPVCGPNERYDCLAINNTPTSKRCTPGCYCINGYERNNKGICVEKGPEQCPDDPNAIIVPCGDPCPITCENKDIGGIRACPDICIVDGCKCKDGYVLEKDGKCTLVENCPIPAKPTKPTKPTRKPTTAIMKKSTIKTTLKPKLVCKKNEVLVECFETCPKETTCSTYFLSGVISKCVSPSNNKIRPPKCSSACRCASGFIRDVDGGKCIKPNQCCKDPNSEMLACPNPCPGGTCKTPKFLPCKRKCDKFGCQCKKGFVKKSDKDATCVPLKDCRKFDSCSMSDSHSSESCDEEEDYDD